MITTVVKEPLTISESLMVRKHRIGHHGKRICIVTGTHGDELEGQYVCYELTRLLEENKESLCGIVDIYPAINPMGIDSIQRGIPGFDLDMNRIFPGSKGGSATEHIASLIIDDLNGADAVIDIHASNIFLRELPQIRISEDTADTLVPLAKQMDIDFIWVHAAATVLRSTLAHSLNELGTPTLVIEAGVGMRITKEYGLQIANGILSLMKYLGMYSGKTVIPRESIISSSPDDVMYLNAPVSGIFLPSIEHSERVASGQSIGVIANPLTGRIVADITSPCNGIVFTIREYPVVDEGSLIARVLDEDAL